MSFFWQVAVIRLSCVQGSRVYIKISSLYNVVENLFLLLHTMVTKLVNRSLQRREPRRTPSSFFIVGAMVNGGLRFMDYVSIFSGKWFCSSWIHMLKCSN
ncbi:unnamed protein product [Lupinus luteus]|uniref:Uncharacterized protein n=1 Tax=Lupinus luteus TaxID=3873 RepID=A0AAV1XDN1_LUPLU